MVDCLDPWHDEIEGKKYHALLYTNQPLEKDEKPILKTRAQWQREVDRDAAKMQPKGFWHGVVGWVPWRNCYRLGYGGMCETPKP